MKNIITSECGHFVLQEETLTDGSNVYNVIIRNEHLKPFLTYPANDKLEAERIYNDISSINWETVRKQQSEVFIVKKKVFFMNVSDKGGKVVSPCIAIEGEAGYHKTDIEWPITKIFTWDDAKEKCKQLNIKMCHTRKICIKIIDDSIRLQILNKI